jgi:glutathione peroxidase
MKFFTPPPAAGSAEQTPELAAISFADMAGKKHTLGDYAGQVIMLVNVASVCALSAQYPALEALYQRFRARGFTVLGFPCNDFASHEPGTNAEIRDFCDKHGVTFPLMDKIRVKDTGQHPLFAALTNKQSPFPGEVKWNFGKFLIGREGALVARFKPRTKPDAPEILTAIEAALGN